MTFLWIAVGLAASEVLTAQTPGCVAVDGDRIVAGDLARALPAFRALPGDLEMGYAPVPGVRRYFQTPELRHLALRYNLTLPENARACIERQMDQLRPEVVIEAMRQALGDPVAHIEVIELSRFPIPRGSLVFDKSALPLDASGAVIWRGFVRYAGDRKYGVWARVRVSVRGSRVVAKEGLAAGHAIAAGQIAVQECDVYPATSAPSLTLEQVAGRALRQAIPANTPIVAAMLDAPVEVNPGDTVQVEVRSGAAILKLEGRAESPGRRGDPIKVHSLATGRSFSANVVGKGRVAMTAAAGKDKDSNP